MRVKSATHDAWLKTQVEKATQSIREAEAKRIKPVENSSSSPD